MFWRKRLAAIVALVFFLSMAFTERRIFHAVGILPTNLRSFGLHCIWRIFIAVRALANVTEFPGERD